MDNNKEGQAMKKQTNSWPSALAGWTVSQDENHYTTLRNWLKVIWVNESTNEEAVPYLTLLIEPINMLII